MYNDRNVGILGRLPAAVDPAGSDQQDSDQYKPI